MKESYRKGVANHPDPESCVASRKAAIEALTGAHAGRVLSCEIIASGVPTSFHVAEGNTAARRYREPPQDSAQSETPGMHGNSTRENRETPSTPVSDNAAGRLEKAHEPEVQHARRWGVGRSRSTDEVSEQRRATARRRAWREGDRPRRTSSSRPRPGRRAGPASRADLLGVREVSTQGQADTVHRAAAPRHGRSAAGQLLRAEARSGAWSRRRDVAASTRRTWTTKLADLHEPHAPGNVSSAAFQASLHPESRWTTASLGHRGPGGQNRPARRRDGPQHDLRRGLSGVLLRVPTWAQVSTTRWTRCGWASCGSR